MNIRQRSIDAALSVLATAAITGFMGVPMTANATVHELAAVACSGVADRHPPGISDPTKKNFAKPVLASGVVVLTLAGPVIGSSPAAKYPEGTSVFNLSVQASTHPAFAHCPKAQDLP